MTPSEMLIAVMERFQHGEPTAALLVWTDENGDVCMKTNCSNTQALGLAEYARENVLRGIFA